MSQQQTTAAGFVLVALVLGAGILIVNRTIHIEVNKVNKSIADLPSSLLRQTGIR